MTPNVWWSRAIFCKVELNGNVAATQRHETGLKAVTARLDQIANAGCDAIELDLLGADRGGADRGGADSGGAAPFAARYGTLDDANELIDELGRKKIRLVLALPTATLNGLSAEAANTLEEKMRFWLSRGVAGFVLRGSGETLTPAGRAAVRRLRAITGSTLGTRVLIGDGVDAAEVQLAIRSLQGTDAKTLRAQLAVLGGPGQSTPPLLTTSGVAPGKALAAVILAQGSAALISLKPVGESIPNQPEKSSPDQYSPEDLLLWTPKGTSDPESDLENWDKSLAELYHASTALRSGAATYLDHDAENVLVWVIRSRDGGAPVLVACNLSASPRKISVTSELRAMGVKGSYLRTTLRSWQDGSVTTLNDLELPAGEVFLGEIR